MTDLAAKKNDVQIACKTCGADLAGPYCSQCGQKHRSTRFTLRSVIKDAIAQFLSLDRGFFKTVISLVQKPGDVIQQYVSGKTILFTSPFRYFLIWITAAQLTALWTGALDELVQGFVVGAGIETDAGTIVSSLTRYYVLGLAGSFPFLVLATLLFFMRTGRNIAEHTIFHLYLSGQFACYVTLALLVLGIFGDTHGAIAFALVFAAGFAGVIRASHKFFNVGKLRAIVSAPLAITGGIVVYALIMIIGAKEIVTAMWP